MATAFIPARGDVVWMSMAPHAGHEQAGRRPVLVISPAPYNRRVGLVLCCAITRQVKGYPFEVAIPPALPVEGAVLSDQVKSLDWHARKAEFLCRLPRPTTQEVLLKLQTLVGVGEA